MAISINLGSGAGSTNGDTLYEAFTKINTMFSTTTKLSNGDLQIRSITVGNGGGSVATNTATGSAALNANTTGRDNTANGNGALNANTTGITNTAIGSVPLASNTTGSGNTAIGFGALYNAVLLSNNTAVGSNALAGNTLYSNCSGLGADTVVNGNNQVQLGNSLTNTYVYGTVQNRSDLRDKTEVRDTVLGLDFINELRPVDYKWDMREDYRPEMPIQGELSDEDFKIAMDEWVESSKISNLTHDGSKKRNRYHHGLIAQEVQDVIEASGVDFGGFQDHKVGGGDDVLSIGYDELISPMIKAIQELTARINALEGN
jgi:hypothetical protein